MQGLEQEENEYGASGQKSVKVKKSSRSPKRKKNPKLFNRLYDDYQQRQSTMKQLRDVSRSKRNHAPDLTLSKKSYVKTMEVSINKGESSIKIGRGGSRSSSRGSSRPKFKPSSSVISSSRQSRKGYGKKKGSAQTSPVAQIMSPKAESESTKPNRHMEGENPENHMYETPRGINLETGAEIEGKDPEKKSSKKKKGGKKKKQTKNP